MVGLNALFMCLLNTLIKMNAVIYARVSSIGDRQSTDRQISDLLDYVKYQNLEISKIFEEHISGAKKNVERPILMQAIDYCKQNDVSILLVSELSRLGRNAFEVLATVKDLIDNGINLYMQKEQYHDIISYLKRGYSIRNVAKLTGKGISTVQRIKSEFNL